MAIHTIDTKAVSPDALTTPVSASNTAGLAPTIDGNSSTPQVLVGYQKDGFGTGIDQGIKVSQQGVDVNTATDSELVMSSAFNSFKIVQTGVFSVAVSPGVGSGATYIDHTLGVSPIMLAFTTSPGGTDNTQLPYFELNGAGFNFVMFGRTDDSVFGVEISAPVGSPFYVGGNPALYFRYYLLVETAATT